ncbi:MAG: alpha-ribazole phosphatase family protein, partial [Bacteroidota bacterium]
CYGQTDVPLRDTFVEESRPIADLLPDDLQMAYTSPLSRCIRLASRLPVPDVILDDRLKELNFGEWEMLPWNEIDRDQLNAWMERYVDAHPPGGENYRELERRVLSFLKYIQRTSARRVAVVTHAGPIRALVAHAIGLPLINSFNLRISPGSVTRLYIRPNDAELVYLNGTGV